MFEALAALAIAVSSLVGVSADSAAQVACNVAEDYYGGDVVCVYDSGAFDVYAD